MNKYTREGNNYKIDALVNMSSNRTTISTHRSALIPLKGFVEENKNFPNNDNQKNSQDLLLCRYRVPEGIGVHDEDEHGDYAPAQALMMKMTKPTSRSCSRSYD